MRFVYRIYRKSICQTINGVHMADINKRPVKGNHRERASDAHTHNAKLSNETKTRKESSRIVVCHIHFWLVFVVVFKWSLLPTQNTIQSDIKHKLGTKKEPKSDNDSDRLLCEWHSTTAHIHGLWFTVCDIEQELGLNFHKLMIDTILYPITK